MFVTVDVQGFKAYDNRFIVKEIAVVFNNEEFHCFHIKAPFEFSDLSKDNQRQANWLMLHHHNLLWSYGSDNFKAVRNYLISTLKNEKVYVKGHEKQMWIAEFLQKPVFNIEEEMMECNGMNLSRLYNLYPDAIRCQYHFNNTCNVKINKLQIRCALKSALIMFKYILDSDINEIK